MPDIFDQMEVGSPADMAVVGIFGTLGFAIDAHLFVGGVPPGTVAGAFATGALGIKMGLENKFERKRLLKIAKELVELYSSVLNSKTTSNEPETSSNEPETSSNEPETSSNEPETTKSEIRLLFRQLNTNLLFF